MNKRRKSGAALAFVAAGILVMVMLGAFFFLLSMQLGGSRELIHATDAGSLNVAKQAIYKPDLPLQAAEERENFQGLLETGQLSLINYNRIVGQTLLVSLNAEAEGTALAKNNAERLIDAVNGPGGISAKLSAALKDSGKMNSHFIDLSLKNSVRMLGGNAEANVDDTSYEVAYLEAGSSSNVDFHPETLPYDENMKRSSLPAGVLSDEKSKRKLSYIAGYLPIKLNGISRSFAGVPLMPGKAPHLVSVKDFNSSRFEPKGTAIVPPNSFKSGGAASNSHAVACSIVGALDKSYTAAIPYGYIVINNGKPLSLEAQLGGNDHIFAQELNNGIFVGPGSGSSRAFTTDAGLYGQWLAYNNAVKNGVTPLPPPPSTLGVHGDPRTILAAAEMVDWTMYADPQGTAADMLPAFAAAYPHANNTISFSSSDLTAVEQWKAKVLEGFGKVSRLHDPTDPAFRQNIPPPAQATGMKAFDRAGSYASPPGPVAFGRPGSLREFLTQTNGTNALSFLQQRLRQIKPDAGDGEIQSVLNTPCIGMGDTYYIYKAGDRLTISKQKPSWANYFSPDGKQIVFQNVYDLNKRFINVPGDGGAPAVPFGYAPDSKGTDKCIFTPSSGYHNLLGTLVFSNSAGVGSDGSGSGGGSGSDAWFWDPN